MGSFTRRTVHRNPQDRRRKKLPAVSNRSATQRISCKRLGESRRGELDKQRQGLSRIKAHPERFCPLKRRFSGKLAPSLEARSRPVHICHTFSGWPASGHARLESEQQRLDGGKFRKAVCTGV